MTETRRILFVDDDRGVLDGLERMLFDLSDQWDMYFVESGQEALEELAEEENYDVIVSDMRMPDMDGATLLQHVHEDFPDVVRIILTGHCEMDATLRAMPVAHSFVTKPCSSEVLEGVVRRACNQRDILQDPAIRSLVGTVAKLPVRPQVYTQLTQALEEPDVELPRLAAIVGRDVGLSSKVLHLTNSAFFGSRRKFVNVEQAVAFIGVDMLKKVVLSAAVFTSFEGRKAGGLSLEREQAHALACAGIAKAITPNPDLAESAFLAGMLHDVGRLVWAARAPKSLRKVRSSKECAYDAEQQLTGTTHARVGAYLLGLWGLGDEIVEAVAYHHEPRRLGCKTFELPTIVHVADTLAHELVPDRSGRPSPPPLDEEHLADLGVLDKLDTWRKVASQLKVGEES